MSTNLVRTSASANHARLKKLVWAAIVAAVGVVLMYLSTNADGDSLALLQNKCMNSMTIATLVASI